MQYRVKENGDNPNEHIPSASLGEIFVDLQTCRVDDTTPGQWDEEAGGGSRPIGGNECLIPVWKHSVRTPEGLVLILDRPRSHTIPRSSP